MKKWGRLWKNKVSCWTSFTSQHWLKWCENRFVRPVLCFTGYVGWSHSVWSNNVSIQFQNSEPTSFCFSMKGCCGCVSVLLVCYPLRWMMNADSAGCAMDSLVFKPRDMIRVSRTNRRKAKEQPAFREASLLGLGCAFLCFPGNQNQ